MKPDDLLDWVMSAALVIIVLVGLVALVVEVVRALF